MNITNGVLLNGVNRKFNQNIDKRLRADYVCEDAINSLKRDAKDTLIVTAGAAGTAAAAGITAKVASSNIDFKSIINNLKPSQIKNTVSEFKAKLTTEQFESFVNPIKNKFTAEKLKNIPNNIKSHLSSDKMKNLSDKIKTNINPDKLKGLTEKIKNPKTILSAGKGKIKDLASKFTSKFKGESVKELLKKGVNKVKNLPGPAKAVLAIGAAITAIFISKNHNKATYNAGKIEQKYEDMSKGLKNYV